MKTSSRVQPKSQEVPLRFRPRRGLDARGMQLLRLAEESYCRLFLMSFDLTVRVTASEIAKETGRREAFLKMLALFYPLRQQELGELSGEEGWLENIRYAVSERSGVARNSKKARDLKVKVKQRKERTKARKRRSAKNAVIVPERSSDERALGSFALQARMAQVGASSWRVGRRLPGM